MKFYYFIVLCIVLLLLILFAVVARGWLMCGLQVGNLGFYVSVVTLMGLLLYAYFTGKIAITTDENTKVTKANFANFYPAFSFYKEVIQSYGAKFIEAEQGGFFLFRFFIHNLKPIPGYVKFDFDFLYRIDETGDLLSSGLKVFAHDIFYPDYEPEIERYYSIQPGEFTGVAVFVDKEKFEEWIDTAYPGLKDVIPVEKVNLYHKISEIVKGTKSNKSVTQPSKLYIRMLMTAQPHELTKSADIYVFEKLFYLKFPEAQHDTWEIMATPRQKGKF